MSWVVSVAFLSTLATAPVFAAESLATVAEVIPQASAGLGANQMTLLRGSDLKEGETVITGAAGEVQIVFSDDTHLVIGRGSSLVIERYLMRNDGTPQNFAVNALAGTFRFITGNGAKGAYSIQTPTGTLGIRGTEFDFSVERGTGLTSVILFEGGVEMCARSGKCVSLDERCEVGQLVSRQDAELLDTETRRLDVAAEVFPYLQSQSRLKREFRVRLPKDCLRKTPELRVAERPEIVAAPPPPPPPPPPVEEEEPVTTKKNNKGLGNGGEGGEGPFETQNPGHNKPKHKHK